MRKRVVFQIIANLDVGGAERVAVSISSSKSDVVEHHVVEVMRGRSVFTEKILAELKEKGIICHRAFIPVLFHWHYLMEKMLALLFPFRFLMLYIKYRPCIVHCHTEIPDMAVWWSLLLMPWMKISVVRTIHNTRLWSGMNVIGPRVERFMQKNKANIAISSNVQEAYHDAYGQIPPIIYNGVSPVSQVRYEGLLPGKKNILFAGRFEEQKGISTLCEIIQRMKGDADYHFHVFGSGRLQHLVDELRGMDNVTVRPPLHDISSRLASFDYVIMPSLHEGLSILALESSFNGVPLMINHCAGLSDTLPEDWPLAVHGNDINEWMHLFKEVIPNVDRQNLVNKSREYVMSYYSMEKMQKEYESFYESKMKRL